MVTTLAHPTENFDQEGVRDALVQDVAHRAQEDVLPGSPRRRLVQVFGVRRAAKPRPVLLLVDEPGNFHYVPKASRSEREAGCSGLGSKKDQDGNPGVVKHHHPCLHPDALVLTLQGGYQPIGKVKIDDLVYSADGCFHLVDDVSRHIYTASCLYDIKIQGTNYSTPASDNHPFLIWRPQREKNL